MSAKLLVIVGGIPWQKIGAIAIHTHFPTKFCQRVVGLELAPEKLQQVYKMDILLLGSYTRFSIPSYQTLYPIPLHTTR